MPTLTNVFTLRERGLTDEQIARKLGRNVVAGPGGNLTVYGDWIGVRQGATLALDQNRLTLHDRARSFADPVEA